MNQNATPEELGFEPEMKIYNFETIFYESPIPQIIVSQGIITACNHAACALLVRKQEELLGRNFEDFIIKRLEPIGESTDNYILSRGDETLLAAGIDIQKYHDSDDSTNILLLSDRTRMKELEGEFRKCRFILEHSIDEIYIANPDGSLEYVNETAANSIGYTIEEMLKFGLTGIDINPDYSSPDAYKEHLQEIKEKGFIIFETTHQRKNGSKVQKAVTSHYMNINGKEYICGFARDISELKWAKKALVESEELFTTVFFQSFHLMGILTVTGEIIQINNTACKYLEDYSLPSGMVLGTPFWETPWWTHDKSQQKKLKDAVQKARSGELIRYVATHPSPSGGLLWIDFSLKPVFNADSEVVFLIAEGRDVTERVEMENQLKNSEHRYYDLANLLPQPVFECNRAGTVLFANQSALSLFGFSDDYINDVVNVFTLIAPDDQKEVKQSFEKLLLGEKTGNTEHRLLKNDGSMFPARIYASRIEEDDEIIGLRGILFDVTEQKEYEKALQLSLDEKNTLLKEIHHRVKNNLQIIASLLNLKTDFFPEGDLKNSLIDIQGKIRAMSLIHEKLYSTEDFSVVNLGHYLEEIALELQNVYQRQGIKTGIEFMTEDINLSVDQAIPCALIANEILSNAFKYAFPETLNREGRIVVVLCKKEGNLILLSIKDNGVGFSSEYRKSNDGKTIGIELIQILTEQIEGTLEINTKDGTAFSITFPMNMGDSEINR